MNLTIVYIFFLDQNEKIINKIKYKAKVKISDGKLTFKVVKKITASKIRNKDLKSGKIFTRKGVNISGLVIGLPSISKQDLKYVNLAA